MYVHTYMYSHPLHTRTEYIHTHYMHTQKSGSTWRTAQKLTALLCILPTALRDFVPAVRKGFSKVIWGLRILHGRCINGNEAVQMHVQAGNRPIPDSDVAAADKMIIEGFAMLEGWYNGDPLISYLYTPTTDPLTCVCAPTTDPLTYD